jgi:UDP-N-acetylmuramate dehydrogenase
VYFVLSKAPKPILNYVDLKKYMETAHKTTLTLNEIREALGEIRGYKFPDYKKMGNDGSCFKNLLLDDSEVRILDENMQKNFSADVFEKYQEIKKKFPVAGKVKMPVAFLVDICGLKGRKVGDAQLWDRQPLVIVNTTNHAKASDVAELFRQVRQEVFAKTGMRLSSEPEWIGFTEHELNHYLKSHE